MPQQEPQENDRLWQQEQEARFNRRRQQGRRTVIFILIVSDILLVIVGLVPMLMGYGFFGYHAWKAEEVPLWVYNTTDHPASIDIAYDAPLALHHTEKLAPYAITHTQINTGERVLRTTVHQLESTHTLDLEHPTIITLGDDTCYAVFDMTPFYHRSSVEDPSLKLVDTVEAGTVVYQVQADEMVVPRQALPRNIHGTMYWVEDFGCELIEEKNRDMLMMRARQKMEEREEALQKQIEEHQRERAQ